MSSNLNSNCKFSYNSFEPNSHRQLNINTFSETEKTNPNFNVERSLQNINTLGEKYLKDSANIVTISKKVLFKKDCKLKSGTVLRRTPRLTTAVKSYSENKVNFYSEKKKTLGEKKM